MSNPDSRTESVSLVEIGRQPGVFQVIAVCGDQRAGILGAKIK